jgi:hypothetical protein
MLLLCRRAFVKKAAGPSHAVNLTKTHRPPSAVLYIRSPSAAAAHSYHSAYTFLKTLRLSILTQCNGPICLSLSTFEKTKSLRRRSCRQRHDSTPPPPSL